MTSDPSRVSEKGSEEIPKDDPEKANTIKGIRDSVQGDYSDKDIYAAFEVCSMNAEGTIRHLQYLEGFQQVKTRRNRSRNEDAGPKESMRSPGFSEQVGRNGREGNNNYQPHDYSGGRISATRKGNGVRYNGKPQKNAAASDVKRGNGRPNRAPVPDASTLRRNRSAAAPTQPTLVSTSNASAVLATPSNTKIEGEKSISESGNPPSVATSSGVYSSASDPVLPPNSLNTSSAGAIGPEVNGASAVRLSKNENKPTQKARNPSRGEVTTSKQKRPDLIFPSSLQVSEAVKNRLIFGTLVASLDGGMETGDLPDDVKPAMYVPVSFEDNNGNAEHCPSNQSGSSTLQEKYLDRPQSPEEHASAELLPSEENVTSDAVPEYKQLKQEGGLPLLPVVQNGPHVAPMLSNQLVQEVPATQAPDVSRLSNLANGRSIHLASPGASLTHPGVLQNPIAASPPVVPGLQQPYHPNMMYGAPLHHYLVPLSLQQSTNGNGVLPPAAAAGIKLQYKPGTSTGNPAQSAFQSPYGSYVSPAVGYTSNPSMASVSSVGNENHATPQSQSKDNNIYVTGQQSDGAPIWFLPGQDPPLQPSSYFNFHPRGQHVAYSAQGASGYPGFYHQNQSGAQLTNGSAVEKMGSLSGAYQQQQHQHGQAYNWNPSC